MSPRHKPTLRLGHGGTHVRRLQKLLTARGFDNLKIDGDFGAKTESALIQFQLSSGLSGDGIAGMLTWRALEGDGVAVVPGRPSVPAVPDARSYVLGLPTTPGTRAVLCALEDVGAMESPKGSNLGPAIAHLVSGYRGHWGIEGAGGLPWCQMAVSKWTAVGLGITRRFTMPDDVPWDQHPYKAWFGGTRQALTWGRRGGRLTPALGPLPACGHQMLMGRGSSSGSDSTTTTRAGHTGLVVRAEGQRVLTVDGNVGDGVKLVWRERSQLTGFVNWWNT